MDYNNKIKEYILKNDIRAEHIELNESCHTVKEAAKAINRSVGEIVKNICMIDEDERLIVAIVKGEDRASTSRIGKVLNNVNKPRLLNEEEVLKETGYPAGGVPSFGFNAIFLIDSKVTESDHIYTGGGSINSLIKINVTELIKVNKGSVVRIRK